MTSGMARVHAVFSGRVQGVAYRYFAEKWASSLGITGWVRNLHDGRVEILAEGSREALDTFLTQLKDGPRMAEVDRFETRWEEATGEFLDFRITLDY